MIYNGREIREYDWKLNTILKQLLQEIETRERMASGSSNLFQGKRTLKGHPLCIHILHSRDTTSVLFFNKCEVVKGVDECRLALTTLGRCFACLKGHCSRECRAKRRCPTCGGKHHPSICSPPDRELRANRSLSQIGSGTAGAVLIDGTISQPPTSTFMLVGAERAIFLQTAKVCKRIGEDPRGEIYSGHW